MPNSAAKSSKVEALLDTGASVTVFPKSWIESRFSNTGGPLIVKTGYYLNGKARARCVLMKLKYGSFSDEVLVSISDKIPLPLIGRDFIDQLNIFFDGRKEIWGVRND